MGEQDGHDYCIGIHGPEVHFAKVDQMIHDNIKAKDPNVIMHEGPCPEGGSNVKHFNAGHGITGNVFVY